MKNLSFLLAFIAISNLSHSQVSYGGEPQNWSDKRLSEDIPFVATDVPDYDRLALEDAITDQYKEVPYRFGVENEVNYGIENSGLWIINPESDFAIWQLGIYCPGARAISLRFDEYQLPQGSEVFIWSSDREEFLGSFTSKNNKPGGQLATGLIHGERVIVEYRVPLLAEDFGKLTIGQIVHGYRSFLDSKFVTEAEAQRGPFGDSGNCEVNINCPEGDDWQVEKRAVAIITEGGYGYCTGALVNNTANDGTPYFLTANHCIQGTDVGNWVFYFNHESNLCSGSTGPTNQSISGSSVVANLANSDFALLLLDETPPANYNVEYAGWDASDDESAVQSAVGIHHPSGDIKKISFENDAPYHDIGNGAQVWWIDNWELGVTEPGSSGSPLFNQDHRIIGQLFGGASGCVGNNGNGQYDFYGRFGESWDYGNQVTKRLREWLDPGNTGVLVLNGFPDAFQTASIDPGATSINNVPQSSCGDAITPTFTLTNHGSESLTSCTIFYQLNNGNTASIDWTGSLAQNSSTTVNLPTLTASNGANTLTVWIANPNGATDENTFNNQLVVNFTATTGTTYNVTLDLTFDNYPEETSWEIANNSNVLYSGGLYPNAADGSQITLDFCLPAGCYNFTMMDTEGDGICCSYGLGNYELVNDQNTILASGGDFSLQEITSFCVGSQSVEDFNNSEVVLYPNPANHSLQVNSKEQIARMEISDMTGRLIEIVQPFASTYTLSTISYPEGVYNVRVITSGSTSSLRFAVRH